MASLTVHDNSILKALFDPEASPSGAIHTDQSIPALPNLPNELFHIIRAREQEILRHLDIQNPSSDVVDQVIGNLTELVQTNPTYASAYVNLAQARRLLLATDDIFTEGHGEESRQLLSDLSEAITGASPRRPSDPVSDHQVKVLSAAHTHRGFLLLRIADLKQKGTRPEGMPESLENCDAEKVEEIANKDFFMGGRYGNHIAQQMSVKTNAYAKMCGAIVKEAMRKEIGESQMMSLRS